MTYSFILGKLLTNGLFSEIRSINSHYVLNFLSKKIELVILLDLILSAN